MLSIRESHEHIILSAVPVQKMNQCRATVHESLCTHACDESNLTFAFLCAASSALCGPSYVSANIVLHCQNASSLEQLLPSTHRMKQKVRQGLSFVDKFAVCTCFLEHMFYTRL